jgi:hypothetical protein
MMSDCVCVCVAWRCTDDRQYCIANVLLVAWLLGSKTQILHEGEGAIFTIRWKGSYVSQRAVSRATRYCT